jgi:allantoinase
MMARLSRQFGVRVHVVHVACADAIDVIARARADGAPITAETCPHYLTFAAEEVPRGATEFKCAPPIRDTRHRAALRNALQAGTLDLVASDHSPAPPAMKCAGDFQRAWGGIAAIEWSLAATWSALAPAGQTRGVDNAALLRLARWTSEAPAALATLDRKGRIAAGLDADMTIWDPAAETRVDPMTQQQRHKLTPYAGRRLRGVVTAVYLRGACVWQNRSVGEGSRGRLL